MIIGYVQILCPACKELDPIEQKSDIEDGVEAICWTCPNCKNRFVLSRKTGNSAMNLTGNDIEAIRLEADRCFDNRFKGTFKNVDISEAHVRMIYHAAFARGFQHAVEVIEKQAANAV